MLKQVYLFLVDCQFKCSFVLAKQKFYLADEIRRCIAGHWLEGVKDWPVASAAAQVPVQHVLNLLHCGIRVFLHQTEMNQNYFYLIFMLLQGSWMLKKKNRFDVGSLESWISISFGSFFIFFTILFNCQGISSLYQVKLLFQRVKKLYLISLSWLCSQCSSHWVSEPIS